MTMPQQQQKKKLYDQKANILTAIICVKVAIGLCWDASADAHTLRYHDEDVMNKRRDCDM